MVQSFIRGCEDDPLPNGEHPSSEVIVWAQSCNYEDLCNVGDGLSTLKPGSGGGSGGGAEGPIIVIPPSQNTGSILSYSKTQLATVILFGAIVFLRNRITPF